MEFKEFFQKMYGSDQVDPWSWQIKLALDDAFGNRLIRIPTGLGKTVGVLGAWLWNRFEKEEWSCPCRLVWCLPMRVLVEQTEMEVRNALKRLGIYWNGTGSHEGKVGVHVLMGGTDCGDWALYPEECAVLIGTQDMLLSRALNRGYAASRARWPMEFGLLNSDTLWIMDEVQLMDVGLATSFQLQAFRNDDDCEAKMLRPTFSWWMSATLQPDWFCTSPDTKDLMLGMPVSTIPAPERSGNLWDVRKTCRTISMKSAKELARSVHKAHVERDKSRSAPTLVVMNTVDRAVEVYQELLGNVASETLRLVHSRFRPSERESWREEFLNKAACTPGTDRIIVATQVIEAGVDMSSTLLFTELAPWSSLVQRFGRCARWGGAAQVVVVDFNADKPDDIKKALPYGPEELAAARTALSDLQDVSPKSLEEFEEAYANIRDLYPYEPSHLLLRHEIEELFDTSPDLSGADIDISRFIRSGDERDLYVFWVDIPPKEQPADSIQPTRKELCAVPFMRAREWLCGKTQRLAAGNRAWVWDWQEGVWRTARSTYLYPGQTVLVAANCGGYDTACGWSPASMKHVVSLAGQPVTDANKADSAQDDDSLSQTGWQTIAGHSLAVAEEARDIAQMLVSELAHIFHLAGRVHDIGKAYPDFQLQIQRARDSIFHARTDIAKAPKLYWNTRQRPRGLRHELASTLALFAILQRHDQNHEALLGPWKELLDAAGMTVAPVPEVQLPPTDIEREILDLDAEDFNLLLYLVCAHHGKIRLVWHPCPADQKHKDGKVWIRGVMDGATLPSIPLYTKEQELSEVRECCLDLAPSAAGLNPHTGLGWTERILNLLVTIGHFNMAWLEAIMRAADQRASTRVIKDPLLGGGQ
ncbi:CRISPR-associated endonuclease/helicase Cas3 [Desulfomicrobium apsheronum]|uniref:CRISPR-associated endonuclease/helicase Cas3 n=1 Tax=Desulfomicrobium apsheronum TaxID=52560 RepID=A0A1I3WEH5_9BACT|nr:CRISPR-associated helicase/endonuclease Cas3 [Desulfomicrobium apsheronum]SFK06084.1 CRISPR-associated endonuclease/helicase Cas3 [Desulfomicrobium apsheronum]